MKAFPANGNYTEEHNGIDLRDYFAAKAMQGLLSNPKLMQQILKQGQSWITESAYAWADAMIEERKDEILDI